MPRAQKGQRFGGRKKGTPNKVTGTLREMISQALANAGGVDYLTSIAHQDPKAFCALLGRTLPMKLQGDDEGGPITLEIVQFTKERVKP